MNNEMSVEIELFCLLAALDLGVAFVLSLCICVSIQRSSNVVIMKSLNLNTTVNLVNLTGLTSGN